VKGDGKLEGKGTKAKVEIFIFVLGNIQQVVAGLICCWVETLNRKNGRNFQYYLTTFTKKQKREITGGIITWENVNSCQPERCS